MGQKKARNGLLSETERQLVEDYKNLKKLRNQRDKLKEKSPRHPKIRELTQKINTVAKRYSALSVKIKGRIESVHDDLRIILNNEKLVSDLKLFGLTSFIGITAKLERLKAPTFEEISEYAEQDVDYSTWRVHWKKVDGKRKYWLTTREEKKPTTRDTDTAYYPILGIKGIYPIKLMIEKNKKLVEVQKIINVKEVLYEALDLMKRFPESHILDKKPRTIRKILDRIEKFKKKLYDLEISKVTEEKILVKPHVTLDEFKEEFPDYVERYQECAEMKSKVLKKLNEYFLQFGFKMKPIGIIEPISKEDQKIQDKIFGKPKI